MMLKFVETTASLCAGVIELLGVVMLTCVAVYAISWGTYQMARKQLASDIVWRQTRQTLGNGILIGLEFLVAADIIETVAVEMSLQSVSVLAIIVLIRTFLSFALEVELTGHWPWNAPPTERTLP